MSKRQIYSSYTLAVTLDLNAQISYISEAAPEAVFKFEGGGMDYYYF